MAKVNVKEQNAENISKSEAFLLKNKKTILYAVIALIVIIAGVILYNNFVKAPREAKASTELAKGQTMFQNQQFAQALNGDSTGYAGFVKIASDYSSTPAGNLANLYAGLCYANLEKWEDAVKFLDKYSPANDEMVSPAAVAALGNAYAHVKQLDKAVDALKKAAKMADSQALDNTNNSLSPTFLIQAATILESQNKKAEALKIYQDIKKKYVNSAVASEIDKYIERAQ
jgi:tetratricopeptide (TPR) repeat protein